MRVALDTNILGYAEGVNGSEMQRAALDLIGRLPRDEVLIPVQALGELFNVLTRKAGQSRDTARAVMLSWSDTFTLLDSSVVVMLGAVDLAAEHRLSIWDAVMLSAAAHASCRLLLSEDLQEGFTWHGVTVANPFLPQPNPLLAELLAGRDD